MQVWAQEVGGMGHLSGVFGLNSARWSLARFPGLPPGRGHRPGPSFWPCRVAVGPMK